MNFITFWQTLPMHLDPTLITIFGEHIIRWGTDFSGKGFPVNYYGLMYIIGFAANIGLLQNMCRSGEFDIEESELENLCMCIIIGILFGGRIGYVLLYNFDYYVQNLSEIFLPFNNGKFIGISGMSFHGAIVGGILCGTLYVVIKKLNWKECANAVFFTVPMGYTFGRFGNFMNGELYGRKTDSAIGMYFPSDPTNLRYPSQLFEMIGEGILLFLILCFLRKFCSAKNLMTPFYLIGYGVIRFFIEFYREPDAHIGLNSFGFSQGQILCTVMIVAGIILIPIFTRRQKTNCN
ncbi:MAG: prolipoprotein diacylglyceryl transferase [Chitinispirillales bacterium]|jgi:phosphatidylglycerol:prolipoprotein diacylglycerol transferase|nr:prolipoprotein diacylglyceryl transferase [Chitinispirillales bacterium]